MLACLREVTLLCPQPAMSFRDLSVRGVRAGCRPVVPDRLSYRELFPKEYRYSEGELEEHLRQLFATPRSLTKDEARKLTEAHSWPILGPRYQKWLGFKRMRVCE